MSVRLARIVTLAIAGALLIAALPLRAAEEAVIVPAPATDVESSGGIQTAVLAGGCFWGVQGVYQHTTGVISAVSGYAGGDKAQANYRAVSSGATTHAEAVEIKYDPRQVSYGKLLQIFFSVVHDPTQRDRQGPDTGAQYRSEIFATTLEQKAIAESYVAQLNAAKVYLKPIATRISTLPAFYPAEAYHQDYLTLHPNQPYIVINDLPKVENLKTLFAANYTPKPALVGAGAKLSTN
jgi:peptide-methionine (S)-S-oxide reductase